MEEKKKGFAAFSPEQRQAWARKGGLMCWDNGRAHKFTKEEAKEAGRLGGLATAEANKKRKEQHVGAN